MSDNKSCAFYACIGSELTTFGVDAAAKSLAKTGSVLCPEQIQYAWQHPVKPFFYVASSSGYLSSKEAAPRAAIGKHYINAFSMDRSTGKLTALGDAIPLPARPIHMTVDRSGEHALVAYPNPPSINVIKLNEDGTLGAFVKQPDDLDFGIYPHQVMVTPKNKTVILVTRGNDAQHGNAEDPGALKVYDFKQGVLSNKASIALNGGYGYGPRDLDFHPTQPWLYVAFERGNALHMYDLLRDGGIAATPRYIKSTLSVPCKGNYKQGAGAIHMHPDGKTVYVANRSSTKPDASGKRFDEGGENTIAVFSIDSSSGEPTLTQAAGIHSFHPRTFTVDPSGRMLITSALAEVWANNGERLEAVASGISTFNIAADGTLEFARKYPLDTSKQPLWWSGIATLSDAH